MWEKIRNFLLQPRVVLVVYVLMAIVASIQLYMLSPHVAVAPPYTQYNNYMLFKMSFFNLIEGRNLYFHHFEQAWDLYKYSPTFALVMYPFASVPDYVGLPIWNILNAVALFAAIRMLPFRSRVQCAIMWFALLELFTSMQSAQSNALMAALMIGTYAFLEKGKLRQAALLVTVAAFIKIYAVVVVMLFLFYPGKLRFIGWCALWTIILAALPLVVTPLHTLLWQYKNWAVMMAEDQSISYGLSVLGWLHSWFGVNGGKGVVTVVGMVLFFAPFTRWRLYTNEAYRLLMLCFILLWVILFNHKAESATYILVMAAVGIWYYVQPRSRAYIALMVFVFVLTCLTPTDLFPRYVRRYILEPYVVKAVPAMVVWLLVLWEIMKIKVSAKINAIM